ncbi:hypothetical protein MYX07_03970 [Patescibacteria group bacterium AH-259-L07]|nr:hypothetical protein [Patescibacteria group bacterium AH-259-L07]
MKSYQTKTKKFTGTDFHEVHRKAFGLYKEIKSKTKRRPYVRSAYFKKEKVFLELFWQHLFDKKNWRDRIRRLKYYPYAIELIQKSRFEPESKENPNKRTEILHRFAGITKENDIFFVQIKEDKRTGQKWLISVFPLGK